MLAEHWNEMRLREIVSFEYGKGLPQDDRSGSGFPVYGSSGEVGRHSEYLISGSAIIVGRKGSVGAVFWSDEPSWPIDTTYYVVPNEQIDMRWCYWLLGWLPLDRLDTSTGVPGLNRHDVYRVVVNVPPLEEQRRIAAILDTVDEAIRQTEKLIAKLKQIKAGLLHDLLTRGLDEEGRLRDPVAHPEQFKETELGRLPVTWKLASGKEISHLITKGASPRWQGFEYQEQGVLFVTSENVRDGYLDVSHPKFIPPQFDETLQRSRLQSGDVLINLVGASIGRSCLVPEEVCPANINQAVCVLRPIQEVSSGWIVNFLQLPQSISRLLGEQVETARANLSLGQIGEFLFPVPDVEEQSRINDILDAHDRRVRAEKAYHDKLTKLKKGLMQDLLTGRVRVTDVALDGVAV